MTPLIKSKNTKPTRKQTSDSVVVKKHRVSILPTYRFFFYTLAVLFMTYLVIIAFDSGRFFGIVAVWLVYAIRLYTLHLKLNPKEFEKEE